MIKLASWTRLEPHGRALAAAYAAYALTRLRRMPTLDARPSGDDSRTQLVATLEATANTCQTLPRLAGLFRSLAEALRRRWPDTDVDLTTPAPYTPRGRLG